MPHNFFTQEQIAILRKIEAHEPLHLSEERSFADLESLTRHGYAEITSSGFALTDQGLDLLGLVASGWRPL